PAEELLQAEQVAEVRRVDVDSRLRAVDHEGLHAGRVPAQGLEAWSQVDRQPFGAVVSTARRDRQVATAEAELAPGRDRGLDLGLRGDEEAVLHPVPERLPVDLDSPDDGRGVDPRHG